MRWSHIFWYFTIEFAIKSRTQKIMTSILSVKCRDIARSELRPASKYRARSNVRTVTQLPDQSRRRSKSQSGLSYSCIAPGGERRRYGARLLQVKPFFAKPVYGVKLCAKSCAESRRARDRYREWFSAKVERYGDRCQYLLYVFYFCFLLYFEIPHRVSWATQIYL